MSIVVNAAALAGSESALRKRNKRSAARAKPPEINNKNKYASRRIIDGKYVSCGIIDKETRIIYFSNQRLAPRKQSGSGANAMTARVNRHTTCVTSEKPPRIMQPAETQSMKNTY